MGKNSIDHGHAYHCVIPHFADVDDYPLETHKDLEYAVYIGRIQSDKGVSIAIDATKALGIKLLVIGNGSLSDIYHADMSHVTHLGVLDITEKIAYLQKARCVFVPTLYIEPFSLACLEAQLCGTPCLVSRWGGPSEIVIHGVTGFQCDTLGSYIKGLQMCISLCPETIRNSAKARFSIEAVSDYFVEYFAKIQQLINQDKDFYSLVGNFKGMGKLCSA
jgi:glycosyltransferase involved in cell wall biosynthesis